jgi:ABC-2 type transport system ATP-binding protein
MPIIEVTDWNKTFRSKLKEPGLKSSLQSLVSPRYKMVEAVKKISFSCEESELLAFTGPNGAGKSSTIKMLTGILCPGSGARLGEEAFETMRQEGRTMNWEQAIKYALEES